MSALTTYYAERLREEEQQLDAVKDALDALDIDGFMDASRRINNKLAQRSAERVVALPEIRDALEALEALEGFLRARIEYLKPLALEERMRERESSLEQEAPDAPC